MKDTLLDIIETLRSLFADKAELKGFNDWDKFIGCVILLEQIANKLPESNEESEMVYDGR